MELVKELKAATVKAVRALYDVEGRAEDIIINQTPREFEGDYTVVVFPFLKFTKKTPEATAREIGDYLLENSSHIEKFNVVKGFLNITFKDERWLQVLQQIHGNPEYGRYPETGKRIVVEYCGPNTNKPLHLGHLRNILIGWSTVNILKANGHTVFKVNIYNDRGIAICKSMAAWIRAGKGETPQSTGIKGDHFVGRYYVEFDRIYRQEVEELIRKGYTREEAGQHAPIMREARELLRKWEAGDEETLRIWKMMNEWVYEGFRQTYAALKIDFDKEYYESETYALGRELVLEGLKKGIFYRKEDGSVWVDLRDEGLDEKVLLRSDGTSVYLTQDLGTAELRYRDFHMDQSIYVVADEQNYHFQVLKLTLKKLGKPYADGIYHLSYGMVDLPTGKMKSREGTVVDADDLIHDMYENARQETLKLGKIEGLDAHQLENLCRMVGMGALKYYILRVDPKKRMLFNPQESIDLHGNTGPFIQYAHARICSVLRKATAEGISGTLEDIASIPLHEDERQLLLWLDQYPQVVKEAGEKFDPSLIANYAYQLAKLFNHFYVELPILNAGSDALVRFRLVLSKTVARILKDAFYLLGIEMPERM